MNYTFSNIKKIKWEILEENNPISLCPIMYPGWCHIIEKTGKILGKPQKNIICFHEGKKGLIYGDHDEWLALSKFVLKKALKDLNFAESLNKEIINYSDKLTSFSDKKIFKSNLEQKSDKELIKLYRNFEKYHGDLYARAIIPVYLDLYVPSLTNYLIAYLEKQIKLYNYPKSARQCFSLLTISLNSSRIQLEETEFLRLALQLNSSPKCKKIFKLNSINLIKKELLSSTNPATTIKKLHKHIEKYRYLGYNFEGPAFSNEYFIKRLRNTLKKPDKIKKDLKKIKIAKVDAKKTIEKITKELKMDKRHREFFRITRDMIYGKDYRKMSLVKSYYMLEPLLNEFAKRSKLDLGEIRNCLLNEIEDTLKGKPPKDLKQRMKNCLFVVLGGNLPGQVFTNNLFIKTKKHLTKDKDIDKRNTIHGQTACPGKAKGEIKIINFARDLKKMKKGDILVSQMTNPDLVPAMKKAAAIVTDLGGITCHAAIVSRELKKPCVIGTRIATQVLKDGDEVEVDADNGIIKLIKD